ncbi:MAG TPA: phosphatidylglycerophosphatase A [Candidatus Handelsmanbacteria bacterium]|nr:phosphatidylglycerophosphatase A [Candidatus Handelsmanbacteria bacterium]
MHPIIATSLRFHQSGDPADAQFVDHAAHAREAFEKLAANPGPVVIDEAAGFLFTVAFLPHGLWTTVAAFLLFRILDILKPPPARQLEKLHGGWGIVLDDVAAGIMGNLLLRAGLALL